MTEHESRKQEPTTSPGIPLGDEVGDVSPASLGGAKEPGDAGQLKKSALTPARDEFQFSSKPYEVYSTSNSELVIGLVGPLGIDSNKVCRMITNRLSEYGYKSVEIRLSKTAIPALAGELNTANQTAFERANALIDMGNKVRTQSKNNAVLAIASAALIAGNRPKIDSSQGIEKVAYIVSSLKRPEEVAELKKIYHNGFYVFGVHCDRELRLTALMRRDRGMKRWEAEKLIARDEHEQDEYGQDMRGTFHLADFFVADEANDDKLGNSIARCIDLIFGHPHTTPTFNEFAMFMAFAASLRSGDLSRQVGAVVAKGGEILSTGANDCPAAGGGLYWPEFVGNKIEDAPRGRDYKRGIESNVAERNELIQSLTEALPGDDKEAIRSVLRKSPLRDITEYGRSVHAEMEALLACARGNTSCVGAVIFCTTFPCHNCAKHIIAAGIKEIIYIEPYPKSKALKFHDDSLATEKVEPPETKVRTKPFIGVGPRLFFDLFSLTMSDGRPINRKDNESGAAVDSKPEARSPRVQMLPFAHRKFEEAAVAYLRPLTRMEESA
jgi:deoxycytidylate deaminase